VVACSFCTSVCAEYLIPASTDTTQEGRIDDQCSKRINQCHVHARESAYAADIDPEVESVSSRCLDQRTQRRSVDSTIDQFNELFVFEAVDEAEEAISSTGRNQ